jgi:branched-subunit amino acid ABC-type transport system permease component
LLQITPAGANARPVERRVTADAGEYAAGALVAVDESVGRAMTRDATFALVERRTPLKLPFGSAPSNVPPLIESENPAVLVKFTSSITRPDGSVQAIDKPLRISWVQIMTVGTSLALMIGLELLVYHTRLGTAMRAVSFNNDYSALMGIPVDRVITITFVLGAVLAAAAGFLYGQQYIGLQQTAHFTWVLLGLKAFVAAVVGGIGNLRGAVVGGFLIAFIEQFGGFYGTAVFANASAFPDVAVFVLLIIVLIVKPSGLFGSTAREKV